jgi:hypothetical protein
LPFFQEAAAGEHHALQRLNPKFLWHHIENLDGGFRASGPAANHKKVTHGSISLGLAQFQQNNGDTLNDVETAPLTPINLEFRDLGASSGEASAARRYAIAVRFIQISRLQPQDLDESFKP